MRIDGCYWRAEPGACTAALLGCTVLAVQSLTRVHPPSQCLHEAVISLFAFRLRSCDCAIGQRRVGRQPKPDKQCQCFIPDFHMTVQSLKLADNPVNAPAECCLHTLRS